MVQRQTARFVKQDYRRTTIIHPSLQDLGRPERRKRRKEIWLALL